MHPPHAGTLAQANLGLLHRAVALGRQLLWAPCLLQPQLRLPCPHLQQVPEQLPGPGPGQLAGGAPVPLSLPGAP